MLVGNVYMDILTCSWHSVHLYHVWTENSRVKVGQTSKRSRAEILQGFQVQTDKQIVVVDKVEKNKAPVKDVVVQNDNNIRKKECDKVQKNSSLMSSLGEYQVIKVNSDLCGLWSSISQEKHLRSLFRRVHCYEKLKFCTGLSLELEGRTNQPFSHL